MSNLTVSLPPAHPWEGRLQCFDTLPSTNDHLKALARQGAAEGTAILADRQTGGHGRMGRSFHSPGGMGVYLSVLLRPRCTGEQLLHLTCAVAVTMCDAVESVAGFRPGIKWTNDLVWNRRKLGGILTELGFRSDGTVDYAILGIGINCCQQEADFPEDIRGFAGSLTMAAGRPVSREALASAMLVSLAEMNGKLLTQKDAILRQYRGDCVTLGQDISIHRGEQVYHGHALDIDDSGCLVIAREDGKPEHVSSGEVSIRGMYGYL